ncbi:MAG: hypothetical protein ACRDXC_11595 [Acidimicrobiales bacterium]
MTFGQLARIAALTLGTSLCAALLASPSAQAGTSSNQIEVEGPANCTSIERSALLDATTKITVSGTNQNDTTATWTTTDHPDGAFKTTNWWWWGTVTVTLYPPGHAPISFGAYVPAAKHSPLVQITNNTVIVTCLGSQGPRITVIVPDLAYGNNWGCIGVYNWNGEYALEKTYSGYFLYDGGTYVSGSTGGYSKTPGSFASVRNLTGATYVVPLDAAIGVQPVCY